MDRKKLIQAMLQFKSSNHLKFSGMLYDAENRNVVACDGRRLLVSRSLFEPKYYSNNCILDEDQLKKGAIFKDQSEDAAKYPDYKIVIPSIPRIHDYIEFKIPEWLKDYSKRTGRSDIPARLDENGILSLTVKPSEIYIDLALLAPLHGEPVRVYLNEKELGGTALIEPERTGHVAPDWFCVLALKKLMMERSTP